MNNEDIKLLLMDLSARLTYGVKIQKINEPESAYRLYSIDTNSGELKFVTFEGSSLTTCNGGYLARVGKLRFKPYLRPMSSMTEEERLLFYQNTLQYNEETGYSEYTYESIDWLNAHHFDVRHLIEKGLAIDCTNLNIY